MRMRRKRKRRRKRANSKTRIVWIVKSTKLFTL